MAEIEKRIARLNRKLLDAKRVIEQSLEELVMLDEEILKRKGEAE